MLSIGLNIIGIILILYSIYTINKDISKRKELSEDKHFPEERLKEHNQLSKEIVEDFDYIMKNKLDIRDNEKIDSNKEIELPIKTTDKSIIKDIRKIANNENTNYLYQKTIELKMIGLTNEEIAKKLNKGIREVEIVLKMYNNRN